MLGIALQPGLRPGLLMLCGLLALAPARETARDRYQHIWIVHSNDIHGALVASEGFWLNRDFPPPIGNAPAAATVVRQKREEARRRGYGFLYIDTGDLFSGTPIGEFSRGKAVIEYLNYVGCDLFVPGNHEFDLGMRACKELITQARAPFLCANVVKQGTDTLWPMVMPDTIIELNGIRFGFFGLLTHYMKWNEPDSSFGPLDVEKHYSAARREIERLRSRGADVIVATSHIGYSHDRNLADSVPGIDVIIGGHSHTGLQQPAEFNRYHTVTAQTYGRLTSLGFLELKVDMRTRRLAGYRGNLIELSADEIEPDTGMARIVDGWRRRAEAGFDVVLGRSRRVITRGGNEEFPLGNLVCDALRRRFDADVALHMGLRNVIPEGDVTYRHVYAIDPFGNTVVTMTVTGQQLREMLELSVNGHHAIFQVSGLKMLYDPRQPIGRRLISAEVAGEKLNPEKDYRLVTNSYLASGIGEYGIFLQGRDVEDTYITIREVVADYIRRNSPVDARIEGRIRTVR